MVLSKFQFIAIFLGTLILSQPGNPQKLLQNSPDKNVIVAASRQAIIETGMSEKYFDEHVSLLNFSDKPGDLRVVWKYSVNGYTATLNDAIGFYTDANKKRVYVHSIKDLLKSTHDIQKTLSRNQATRLMTSCIGKHGSDSVVFLKLSNDKYASFYLTAHSLASAKKPKEKGEAQEKDNRQARDRDSQESEDIEKPLKIGYINLETGRCTRAEAVVAP